MSWAHQAVIKQLIMDTVLVERFDVIYYSIVYGGAVVCTLDDATDLAAPRSRGSTRTGSLMVNIDLELVIDNVTQYGRPSLKRYWPHEVISIAELILVAGDKSLIRLIWTRLQG